MPFSDSPEQEDKSKSSSDFSISKFFHDAYQHPLTAAAERPREAVAAVALVGATAVAAIYSRRALAGLLREGDDIKANLGLLPSFGKFTATPFRPGASEAEKAEALLKMAQPEPTVRGLQNYFKAAMEQVPPQIPITTKYDAPKIILHKPHETKQ